MQRRPPLKDDLSQLQTIKLTRHADIGKHQVHPPLLLKNAERVICAWAGNYLDSMRPGNTLCVIDSATTYAAVTD
ncbi:hypothetical protein M2401_003703 [Pseudomonas sp. JUb42]|nr:hypothetical protein [Pseudomonas sp. JUb42]MCS3469963.1 hypothetical protein [Pseudomonas sp. JUb42]